jgi:hypothetical protein
MRLLIALLAVKPEYTDCVTVNPTNPFLSVIQFALALAELDSAKVIDSPASKYPSA